MLTNSQTRQLGSILAEALGGNISNLLEKVKNLSPEQIQQITTILNNKFADTTPVGKAQTEEIIKMVAPEVATHANSSSIDLDQFKAQGGSKYYSLDAANKSFSEVKDSDGYVRFGKYWFKFGVGSDNNIPETPGLDGVTIKVSDNKAIKLGVDDEGSLKVKGLRSPSDWVKAYCGWLLGDVENKGSLIASVLLTDESDEVFSGELKENQTHCTDEEFKVFKFIESKYRTTWNNMVAQLLSNPSNYTKIPRVLVTLTMDDAYSNEVIDFDTFKKSLYTKGLVKDAIL